MLERSTISDEKKLMSKGIKSVRARVGNISDFIEKPMSMIEFRDMIIRTFVNVTIRMYRKWKIKMYIQRICAKLFTEVINVNTALSMRSRSMYPIWGFFAPRKIWPPMMFSIWSRKSTTLRAVWRRTMSMCSFQLAAITPITGNLSVELKLIL